MCEVGASEASAKEELYPDCKIEEEWRERSERQKSQFVDFSYTGKSLYNARKLSKTKIAEIIAPMGAASPGDAAAETGIQRTAGTVFGRYRLGLLLKKSADFLFHEHHICHVH